MGSIPALAAVSARPAWLFAQPYSHLRNCRAWILFRVSEGSRLYPWFLGEVYDDPFDPGPWVFGNLRNRMRRQPPVGFPRHAETCSPSIRVTARYSTQGGRRSDWSNNMVVVLQPRCIVCCWRDPACDNASTYLRWK